MQWIAWIAWPNCMRPSVWLIEWLSRNKSIPCGMTPCIIFAENVRVLVTFRNDPAITEIFHTTFARLISKKYLMSILLFFLMKSCVSSWTIETLFLFYCRHGDFSREVCPLEIKKLYLQYVNSTLPNEAIGNCSLPLEQYWNSVPLLPSWRFLPQRFVPLIYQKNLWQFYVPFLMRLSVYFLLNNLLKLCFYSVAVMRDLFPRIKTALQWQKT